MNLSKERFLEILKDVEHQVFEGKGIERHGQGTKFEDQPWAVISSHVGSGFVIGQALKKLMELKVFEEGSPQWKREALGAIVYTIMGIMWSERNENN